MTPLQIASLYATIAERRHRGSSRTSPPSIDGPRDRAARPPLFSPRKAARTLSRMLQRVVTPDGTGVHAKIPGYTVAGKTGTTQKFVERPVPRTRTSSRSFVGFAPARARGSSTLVMVDEPQARLLRRRRRGAGVPRDRAGACRRSTSRRTPTAPASRELAGWPCRCRSLPWSSPTLCADAGAPRASLGAARRSRGRRHRATTRSACRPGRCSVCVPGARVDGHEHAPGPSRAAPSRCWSSASSPLGVPQIVVRDARAGMAPLADALFGDPSGELAVVGVTGTNGKTTTAFLLAAILEAAGRPCGLLGTVERRIGGRARAAALTTPEATDLQRRSARCSTPATRPAPWRPRRIALALAPARRRCVRGRRRSRTSRQDHLDFHGDHGDYFAAKAALFDGRCPRGGRTPTTRTGRRLAAELRYGVERRRRRALPRLVALRPDRHAAARAHAAGRALAREPRCAGASTSRTCSCAVALALLLDLPPRRSPPASGAVAGRRRAASSRSRPASRSR